MNWFFTEVNEYIFLPRALMFWKGYGLPSSKYEAQEWKNKTHFVFKTKSEREISQIKEAPISSYTAFLSMPVLILFSACYFPLGYFISIHAGKLEFPWIPMNLFCEFVLYFPGTVHLHVDKRRQVYKIMEVFRTSFLVWKLVRSLNLSMFSFHHPKAPM